MRSWTIDKFKENERFQCWSIKKPKENKYLRGQTIEEPTPNQHFQGQSIARNKGVHDFRGLVDLQRRLLCPGKLLLIFVCGLGLFFGAGKLVPCILLRRAWILAERGLHSSRMRPGFMLHGVWILAAIMEDSKPFKTLLNKYNKNVCFTNLTCTNMY